jgi:hypothetical protein
MSNVENMFDAIAIDPMEVECKGVDCIEVAQDSVQWWVFVNTSVKIPVA